MATSGTGNDFTRGSLKGGGVRERDGGERERENEREAGRQEIEGAHLLRRRRHKSLADWDCLNQTSSSQLWACAYFNRQASWGCSFDWIWLSVAVEPEVVRFLCKSGQARGNSTFWRASTGGSVCRPIEGAAVEGRA
jgi:hypothetical protein